MDVNETDVNKTDVNDIVGITGEVDVGARDTEDFVIFIYLHFAQRQALDAEGADPQRSQG